MSKLMLSLSLILGSTILFLSSCENEKAEVITPDPNPTSSTEYVAADADFQGFRNWTVVVQLSKAQSADGRAHTDAARTVWIKQANAVRDKNGQYPNGTVFVKEVLGGYGIVAMVKRGGTYNSAHNGWEWFHLDSAGKITSRNSSSVCNNCHAQVKNQDYAFTKN